MTKEKSMKEYLIPVAAIVLATLTMFTANSAIAVPHPYEFHDNARMAHASHETVSATYGYMYVLTDKAGNGTINVMFSNGSRLNWANFNARVKFVNNANVVVKEEYFDCWVGAAGHGGENECKVSRPLTFSDFDAIEVDFYLSDISDTGVIAVID